MTHRDERCRPEVDLEAASKTFGGVDNDSTVRLLDALLLDRRSDHAVLVAATMPRGGVRTQVYRSLHAAQKAVHRAEDRGQSARLCLVRLVPVTSVSPAELVDLEGVSS